MMDNRCPKLNRRGFTLAETLIAVGIIAVLSAVIFISVINYLRTMQQLERDGIAKEIFVSAQNHLTTADSQGYLGKADFGQKESGREEGDGEVFYFVVNGGESFTGDTVLDLMLPYASIDETVRLGGSYIVRYEKEPARVLDVFYCTRNGTRFGHSLSEGDYSSAVTLRGPEHKKSRRKYGSAKAVLGWYGGEEAGTVALGKRLGTPTVELVNAERLIARVKDPNDLDPNALLKVIVTGEKSGAKKEFTPSVHSADRNIEYDNVGNVYIITLDDITTKAGLHFSELFGGAGFIPGEDIIVQAVSYSSSVYTNVAYSSEKRTNSLFASTLESAGGGAEDGGTTAYIGNFRHLENLDRLLSGVNARDAAVRIDSAVQTTDLDWADFRTKAGGSGHIYRTGETAGGAADCYLPVTPSYPLHYDGRRHTITGVKVDHGGSAGLFGALTEHSKVQDLMLVDFEITSAGGDAGALAGRISDTEILNVLAIGTSGFVKGTGDAGGLVGNAEGGSLTAAAAALFTEGDRNAGGLVGRASGTSFTGCYSGGHTTEGKYSDEAEDYNVRSGSGTAGGFIGEASGVTVGACYSTCSVSGGTLAGGFLGSADGSFSDCYAVGLVDQTGGGASGQFAGSFSGSAEGCRYLKSINWKTEDGSDGSDEANPGSGEGSSRPEAGNQSQNSQNTGKDKPKRKKVIYLPAVGGEAEEERDPEDDSIAPADADTASYTDFFRGPEEWAAASPYDTVLIRYYKGKYSLKTVCQLPGGPGEEQNYYVNVHYGDWPSPEIMLVNEG